ncbi:hypothetical protein ACIRP3_17820 [Streptomyces sp. NPDC101209]|uniref:hypothetical protein n=1 Tax=Streptomyces sp. NPDC101209 TaxID=3366129 RepID=UPI0038197A17
MTGHTLLQLHASRTRGHGGIRLNWVGTAVVRHDRRSDARRTRRAAPYRRHDGGSATYDSIQAHFAGHPDTPFPNNRIGGMLGSARAVRRRVGPDSNTRLLEHDDRTGVYRIQPALVEGVHRGAFTLADARSCLLPVAGAGTVPA